MLGNEHTVPLYCQWYNWPHLDIQQKSQREKFLKICTHFVLTMVCQGIYLRYIICYVHKDPCSPMNNIAACPCQIETVYLKYLYKMINYGCKSQLMISLCWLIKYVMKCMYLFSVCVYSCVHRSPREFLWRPEGNL